MRPLALLICLTFFLPQPLTAAVDSDGDGLLNEEEDSNGNGQVDEGETNPWNADTDGGGEADGSEIAAGRNPLLQEDDFTFDRDGDGLLNGQEEELGTDPYLVDTDGDGVDDKEDLYPLDPNYNQDNDQDGLPDEYEQEVGLSPDDPTDGDADLDGDGLSNRDEFIFGTDPKIPDTDKDGTADGLEVEQGTDPDESACLQYGTSRPPFADTQGHWANTFITRLQRTKILPEGRRLAVGYEEDDRTVFRPNDPISRFELLKLTLMSTCISLADAPGRLSFEFTDVPSATRPHETEDSAERRRVIYTAFRKGVVRGYPDGSFRPDDPVNRAEALKILFEAAELPPYPDADELISFPDVPLNAWYHQYVQQAVNYQIASGYQNGTFGPNDSITRAEAAKLIFLMMITNPHVNGYVLPAEGLEPSPPSPASSTDSTSSSSSSKASTNEEPEPSGTGSTLKGSVLGNV